MDSFDLTREQCEAIQSPVARQRRYFDQLIARMDANDFPHDDRLRRDAEIIRDALGSFWMQLHYLTFAGQTGGERR